MLHVCVRRTCRVSARYAFRREFIRLLKRKGYTHLIQSSRLQGRTREKDGGRIFYRALNSSGKAQQSQVGRKIQSGVQKG